MPVEPTPPTRKLVILEEGLLIGLSNNNQYLNAFPFLNAVRKLTNARRGGCGKCGTAAKERGQIMQSAKQAVIALSEDKKREFKRMLNAEKIQIKYRAGQKIVTHQF
jgi:sulfur relay (sulfurtransferase) complex TusBCD TusD component (DsrE family)